MIKVRDLIKQLEFFPPDMDVAILDWRLNILSDLGEDTGTGIYDSFCLEAITDDEERPGIDERDRQNAGWLAIAFDNPDFEDEFAEPRTCRVCGCTDDDCTQCIRKTGHPCHWVGEDLCSACVGADGEPPLSPAAQAHPYDGHTKGEEQLQKIEMVKNGNH